MKIAILSDVYRPVINGVVNHVSLLKKYLEAWGEQVWLFVPGSKGKGLDEENVISIPGIPIADTGYHLSISLDQRSRRILRQVDVIHVHHPFISGSIGLTYARRHDIPLIFTNHTRYDLYVQQYLPLLPDALSDSALQTYFQLFSQRCSALIAPSPGIERMMRDWGVHSKVMMIPNGIELDRFTVPSGEITRETVGFEPDAVVAIYVGRMSGEKRVERLLRVFSDLFDENEQLRLLLVGGGPDLAEYRNMANQLRITEKVHFTGSVSYESIPDYLLLSDIFCSASVSEVHPLTFIEAAAAGLALVGVDSPGVSDVIEDGVSGFLARESDLSFGLRVLRLAEDKKCCKMMGQEAQRSSQQFSAHATARQVLQLYGDVADLSGT